jgi:hypothetical protein
MGAVLYSGRLQNVVVDEARQRTRPGPRSFWRVGLFSYPLAAGRRQGGNGAADLISSMGD